MQLQSLVPSSSQRHVHGLYVQRGRGSSGGGWNVLRCTAGVGTLM